ncbi:MAG: T9SS type A sorting domain-containing protein [Williamsia sp.]|nr:T9SS type A sorting domain-containing protein [Williamsia sp.]
MKRFWIGMILLAACVQGNLQVHAQKKLLILGSSTPACYGLSTDSCYVGRLQRYYQQKGTPIVIDNRAVSGDNCYHGMPTSYTPPAGRNAPRPYNNITEGLQGNPDVVLVNYPSNGYDIYSVAEVLFCLRTIWQTATNAGKPCYIATSQPRSEPASYQTTEVRQKMEQIKQGIINEFGQYAINFWDGIANPADNSILSMYNSGDGTHLNSAGHNVLFNRVVEKNLFGFQSGNLTYRYYQGNWNGLPDFNALQPVKTGTATNISLDPRNSNDYFGFVWEGYINIPAPGTYTFETISDDGSKFYFNSSYNAGANALVNNDGLHAPSSAAGSVYVAAAGAYPIAVSFFEKEGGETMQLYWSGPGLSRQPVPDGAFTTQPKSGGLSYRYYEGDWNNLPDFNALTPVKTGSAANISLDPRNGNDHFGFVWEGWINIPAPGQYQFETVSDDGSKFYFNTFYSSGASALVSNDGLHAPAAVSGSVYIPAAGTYPVAISFFEKDGGETMQLYWSGPGFGRQPIPDGAFTGTALPANGLAYRYYEGNWNSLPDFGSLSPLKTGTAANIDLNPRNRSDYFGFVWEGWLSIPAPGTYTFETISDDGSKFYFNSRYSAAANALVSNDGLHAPTSVSGSVYVPAAGSYPVAAAFFEKEGGETMQLYWSGPGFSRQPVPDWAFHGSRSGASSSTIQAGQRMPDAGLPVDTKGFRASVYPNPFAERVNIRFLNDHNIRQFSTDVYDLAGRLQYRRSFGNLPAGNHQFSLILDEKQLTPGIYFVKLLADGKVLETIKMNKRK